jgi:hypothetical protein
MNAKAKGTRNEHQSMTTVGAADFRSTGRKGAGTMTRYGIVWPPMVNAAIPMHSTGKPDWDFLSISQSKSHQRTFHLLPATNPT